MGSNLQTGQLGEYLAARYLVKRGYKILAKNWRYGKVEIDLIALKDELLCCVEVEDQNAKLSFLVS